MTSRPIDAVARYYTAKLSEHGATAAGVDWNSTESQELRFRQVTQIFTALPAESGASVSLIDYGCGYGALFDFLRRRGVPVRYTGYDVSDAMIRSAGELFRDPAATFTSDAAVLSGASFTVASGIFSVKLDIADDDWWRHVVTTLDHMNSLSDVGFSFNMLTAHSDADRRRPDLYYADPSAVLAHCIERYSRWTAVLHDYDLYEFTVLVRKTPRRS